MGVRERGTWGEGVREVVIGSFRKITTYWPPLDTRSSFAEDCRN